MRDKLNKEILKQILIIAEKKEFPLVVIKIYEILKENIKCLDIFITNDKVPDKEEKLFIFIEEFMSKSVNSELKKYKNELINRIDKLTEIDIEKSLDISLKWLKDDQLKIIDKISINKGKKLKYIEKYLNYHNNYSSVLNEEENKKENDKDYNKILITYIDILCRLNKKEDIIKLFKSDSSYINNDCLKICLKNNISEAAIYIYTKQEKYMDALKLCQEELTKIINEIIQTYLKQKTENISEILNKYEEFINDIFSLCEKENKQKVWFDVLEFFFDKLKTINSKEEKEKQNLSEIKSKITNDINNLILRMHSYVDIKKFLEEIYKKPKIIEFKGLGKILYNFIKEQITLQDILGNVISVLDFSLNDNFKLKNKLINKRMIYKIIDCDFCHKIFQDNDSIILFKCGHVCHSNICCINNDECRICYLENEKMSVGSFNEKINNKSISKDKNIFLNNDKKEAKETKTEIKEKNSIKGTKYIYNQFNHIDDCFRNRKSLIEVDIDKIKKNKFKNKKIKSD